MPGGGEGKKPSETVPGKLAVKVLALRESQEDGGAEVDVGWETGLYACDAWNETKGRRMVGYDDDEHTER
jgi:hypothetical protein